MKKIINIKTDRLLIRSILLDDAKAVFTYKSDPVENQYQGWIPATIDDVHDFINNKVSSTIDVFDTWHQFVIIRQDNDKIIGDLGVHFIDRDKKQVEIGCTLDKNNQGNGYATEALSKIIDYLFMTLNKHRITTSIDPDNINSIALVERLKFRKEAHFKKSLLINGEWKDDIVYAILKDEWIVNRSL